MGVHTRMGCDSLLLDLSIDLLRKICCIADTHDLGDKGVWGMCCVKMLGDVCYEGVVSQIDTGQFFCHYCIKKDFIRFSSDTSGSASENEPLLQVVSRMRVLFFSVVLLIDSAMTVSIHMCLDMLLVLPQGFASNEKLFRTVQVPQ
jgi:hypothetical protein